MNKNKIITVARVVAGLICWFAISKSYGAFVDPLLENILPETIRMILASMAVPYTAGLGAFCLAVCGMPKGTSEEPSLNPGFGTVAKFFVIQTGLSFPVMTMINTVLTVTGVGSHSLSAGQLFAKPIFYIILLLIFNPVFEELLFRKLVIDRLAVLGSKGAMICSALLFALPHVYSQGIAQMFYTFALGLVWAYLYIKTGKLWPAIILHSLSNIYCAYIPIIANSVHPALSVLFVMFTVAVMVPLTIVFIIRTLRKPATNLK